MVYTCKRGRESELFHPPVSVVKIAREKDGELMFVQPKKIILFIIFLCGKFE